MQFSVNIATGEGETFSLTPEDAATEVLSALGGDPDKDHCIVVVGATPTQGAAGTPQTPPS